MAKKSIIIGSIILTLLIMFGFINKLFKGDDNETKTKNQSTIVLGMALLNDTQKIDFKKITDELKYKYELKITDQNYDEEKGVGVIGLKNSQIAIAMIDWR